MIKSEYHGVDKGDLIENFIDAIKNDTEPQISKKEIFKESFLENFKNLAAVMAIPDLLTPGIKDKTCIKPM